MEGPVFRKLTVAERNEIVPRLQVSSSIPTFSATTLTTRCRYLLDRRPKTRRFSSKRSNLWEKSSVLPEMERTMDLRSRLPTLDSRTSLPLLPSPSVADSSSQNGYCWNRSREGSFRHYSHGRQLLQHRLRHHVGSMCQRFRQEVPPSKLFVLFDFDRELTCFSPVPNLRQHHRRRHHLHHCRLFGRRGIRSHRRTASLGQFDHGVSILLDSTRIRC